MFRESSLTGITCVMISLPLLFLIYSAAAVPDPWNHAFSTFDFILLHRLWNTIQTALWDVFFSILFAGSVYWVYVHVNDSCKLALCGCSILPFTFPSFATASSWMIMLAKLEQDESTRIIWGAHSELSGWLYSVIGCGFILALHDWPILFFFLVLTTRLTQNQIDACRLYLKRGQMFTNVFFPAFKMPLICGSITVFSFAITHFETGSLLQIDVYMLEIYTQFSSIMNLRNALLLCLPYLILSFGFAFILMAIWKNIHFYSGQIQLQGIPYCALSLLFVTFVLSVFIPISGFFFQTNLGDIVSLAWMQTGRILNSLLYSAGGAGITVLFGLLLAKQIKKQHAILITVCGVLFFLPGILIAAGVLELRSFLPFYLPNWLSRFFLIYAHICHFALIGVLTGGILWQHYGQSQLEFEQLLHIPLWKKVCFLYAPGLWHPAMKATVIIALFIWSDVAVTVLLHPPGGDTLTVYYFNQLHFGSDSKTAAAGVLLLSVPLLAVALFGLAAVIVHKRAHTKSFVTAHPSSDG